jgi:hypothetical protein
MGDKKKLAKFVEDFSTAVNMFMGKEELKATASACCSDHRTLQQNKMRLIMEMLKVWDNDFVNGNYDMRNEQTCRVANKIMGCLNEYEDTVFPTV